MSETHAPVLPALLPTYTPFPFEMARGEGDAVVAADGSRYLDWYGGHCVVSTGHCHPRVVAALREQAGRLLFYSTAGDLRIRRQAAEALLAFADGVGLASVYFCNSGAEANENALKIARLLTGRQRILCFSGGWHGRSLACLAATDDPKITTPYAPWLPPACRLPFDDVTALEAAPWPEIAAVLVEPVQSLSGIRVASPAWMQALQAHCRRHGSLLILDEIQTGVGRLGSPFAAHRFGLAPDLVTCAKGLASGVPVGAVLMRAEVARGLKQGDLGSTFGGGPLAMAALLATLAVIADEGLMARAAAVEQRLRAALAGHLAEVRGLGLLLGLVHDRAAELKAHLYQRRILVGASADPRVLRLLPPLGIGEDAISALTAAITEFSGCPT